jgi:hypothetical protein
LEGDAMYQEGERYTRHITVEMGLSLPFRPQIAGAVPRHTDDESKIGRASVPASRERESW